MKSLRPTIENLKALTSLRFVAALMIVFYHASNYFPWAAWAKNLFLNQGVSFFFVLSGFILTHVYTSKSVSYSAFLWARFARIYPTHLVTCLLVISFIRPDSRQFPGVGFFDPLVVLASNLTLTHSLPPFINYTYSWNSVSWSISTEMFFYLAFPLLLVGIRRNWYWKLACAVGIICAYAIVASVFHIPATSERLTDLTITFLCYASPLFRGFEFVLGMSAYVVWRRLRTYIPGLLVGTVLEAAAVVVVILWFRNMPHLALSPTFQFWLNSAGGCGVFAILIVAMASASGVIGKALKWRPLVWLGEVSFALYMVHQLLMKWIYIKQLEGQIGPVGPVTVFGACLIAAAILHHLVEGPARKSLMGQWVPFQLWQPRH